ncbi:hypothetical protein [Leptothrix ochracea]|uniref:hypothetical protein n=1 Tax=Leptothrix ochracea TaxID=735331 RepID=UPI0034E2A923
MRMQIDIFPLITAIMFFACGVWLMWSPFSTVLTDEMLPRYGIGVIFLALSALLFFGKTYPLRLMSAGLFLMALLSLFMFSGFDDSGINFYRKVGLVTVSFSVAAAYLYFLKKFEASHHIK